jgi:protein-disulfide isomerase
MAIMRGDEIGMTGGFTDLLRGWDIVLRCFVLSGLIGLSACAGGLLGFTEDTGAAAPAKANVADIKNAGPLGEKTLGKPDAPVTIVEYASLGCPICAVFHKQVFAQVKKTYIDTGKVYFIYREFPIGPASASAAQAARCVSDKTYFRTNDKLMAGRGQWNGRAANPDALYKIVQETGLDRAAFDTCMANQKINEAIVAVKQRGRELGVKGTPTFFVNGQQIRGGMSFEEMRSVIEQHLHGAAKPA